MLKGGIAQPPGIFWAPQMPPWEFSTGSASMEVLAQVQEALETQVEHSTAYSDEDAVQSLRFDAGPSRLWLQFQKELTT